MQIGYFLIIIFGRKLDFNTLARKRNNLIYNQQKCPENQMRHVYVSMLCDPFQCPAYCDWDEYAFLCTAHSGNKYKLLKNNSSDSFRYATTA